MGKLELSLDTAVEYVKWFRLWGIILKTDLIVILTFISLMTYDAECLFAHLLAFLPSVHFPGENRSNTLPTLN